MRTLAGLLVLLGVFPLANLMTGGRAVPWFGGAAMEWTGRGLLLAGVAVLLGWRAGSASVGAAVERWMLALSPRGFGLCAALIAVAAAAAVSQIAFAGQPFTSDEMAQQFHARILASGHLAARAEPLREFFNTAPVVDTRDLWFSQYPIGGPALIAFGVLFGGPWLVNPIVLGAATFCLYRLCAKAADEMTARVATLLFVTSPMVLVMAGSQMNHVASLALATAALLAVVEWDTATTARAQALAGAAAGAALGVLATIRPLDAALVGVCIGTFQLLRLKEDTTRLPSLAIETAAAAVPVALLLWVNALTTGGALLFGYEALNGAAHSVGFHVDPNGVAHTPLRGLTLASGYLMRLSLYLFEWPLPGVLVIAAGLAATRNPTRRDALMAGLIAAFVLGYAAYWFDGFFAGPRFLFTAVPAFVFFAARAPALAEGRPEWLRRAAGLTLPLCVLTAWLGPWQVSSAPARIADYRSQRTKLKSDIERQVASAGLTHALVFVHESWRGNLLARLRVLGATQFRAERVLNSVDACALQSALDAEDDKADADTVRLERAIRQARALGDPRPVPNLQADQAIYLVPGSTPTATCLSEFSRDSLGTMPFAAFLAKQSFDRDGRVGGAVVFARDLGARNERLRSRFGDRAWYLYRSRGPDDTSVFVPYR